MKRTSKPSAKKRAADNGKQQKEENARKRKAHEQDSLGGDLSILGGVGGVVVVAVVDTVSLPVSFEVL